MLAFPVSLTLVWLGCLLTDSLKLRLKVEVTDAFSSSASMASSLKAKPVNHSTGKNCLIMTPMHVLYIKAYLARG